MYQMQSVQLLLLLAAVLGCASAFKIEAMKHDIQQITATNFDGVIGKFRDISVSSLWFFKESSAEDKKFLEEYNKVATTMKGMSKVCAISCEEFPVFCQKNNIKETPAIMIYPTNPIPAFKWDGKLEAKAISGRLSKLLPDFTTKLTKDNIDTYLTTEPTKPKVMLFTDKKGAPTIWKALSGDTVFKRTVKFGYIVQEESADLSTRFKVKKFPTVIMQREVGGKPFKDTYSGDLNFLSIKEWVNPYVESGMGMKMADGGKSGEDDVGAEDAKPWLVQEVPELTQKSQGDICFKGEGLCVMYLKEGEITAEETEMLTGLSKKFTSQLSDRGAKMKWMWMNLAVETGFKTLFAPDQTPTAVVFNPHKRLRFTKLDHGEDGQHKGDAAGIGGLLDKVLGGDARFTMVPGQKLPAWVSRDAKKDKKEL